MIMIGVPVRRVQIVFTLVTRVLSRTETGQRVVDLRKKIGRVFDDVLNMPILTESVQKAMHMAVPASVFIAVSRHREGD